ncbi:hypothetical protein OH77DRAFT_1399030 [Trametes cingulata]|nr:hypothetical protein OH77DRAFT_1399030 [Trametes cingulata]
MPSDHFSADNAPYEPPAPILTVDVGVAQYHEASPSVDSGYAPSLRLGLSCIPNLARLYEEWNAADTAVQKLPAELHMLEQCKTQLADLQRSREVERRGRRTQRRLSSMAVLRRRSLQVPTLTSVTPGTALSDVCSYASSTPEQELEARLDALHQMTAATRLAAERLDSCFEELLRAFDDESPVSARSPRSFGSYATSSISSDPDPYRRARKTVSARDEAYQSAKATTDGLQRACRAVQAAHRFYKDAKDALDTVCGPNKSFLVSIFSDEESRHKTYLEAMDRAQKAQLCFDECLNLLRPHWDLLKQHEIEAYDYLKNAGLLQAATLYKLMYRGPNFAMGIRQEVQVMVQRQHDVFLHLTNFAAGVQSCKDHCEAVEREARDKRDAARRQLVALWAREDEDVETYSLASASVERASTAM